MISSSQKIKINCFELFTPQKNEIFYIETYFDKRINTEIKNNHDKISSTFAKKGFKFVYIPKELEYFSTSKFYTNDIVSQQTLNKFCTPENITITTNDIYRNIFCHITDCDFNISKKHCFLLQSCCYDDNDHPSNTFRVIDLTNTDSITNFCCQNIDAITDKSETTIHRGIVRYSEITTYIADLQFQNELQKLQNEISERIFKMRELGVNELVIKSFCEKLISIASTQPSKLHITQKGKIFLPDYNNIEISMTPLVKSVYFLFLRYPNGLLFKNLVDHKKELSEFYLRLTNRFNFIKIQTSVNSVVNPSKNSINEKCSRIREAFTSQINNIDAYQYYITGGKLTPKKIILNRDFVIDEFNILK